MGQNRRQMTLELGESRHPVFRATSPLSRGHLKSKGGGKLSIHYCADLDTIKTVFRTIISSNSSVFTEQSQKCVKSTKPSTIERSNPLWEGNQVPHSVLSVIKTEVLLECDDLAHKDLLLQQYMENELKSYHNKTD